LIASGRNPSQEGIEIKWISQKLVSFEPFVWNNIESFCEPPPLPIQKPKDRTVDFVDSPKSQCLK
jgi:hypothetical protein